MELIVRPPRTYHVSHDTVLELEEAILRDPRVAPATTSAVFAAAATGATRLLRRAGVEAGSLLGGGRRGAAGNQARRDYLAVMMGLDAAPCAPWFIRPARKSVYLFDAWPSSHTAIRRFVEGWGVQYAFVSSSQAAERLAAVCDRCTFIWIPEGVDPARYQQRSYVEKALDVLQLGRKYDAHHALIAPALEKMGKTYFYEREKGTLVFALRDDYVSALARTRISICVPSAITHPERAGDIQTMTVRYLQSMASKCLVLGHAPAEMVELFGYDPVVEIDMTDPVGQIMDLLENFESYVPLIERNFELVVSQHTWARRWERIAAVLFPEVTPFQRAVPPR